ncbi:MAG: PD-(D/E)XK nuclease family protein, partial [Thermohalobaculum sp.]|nr:PD-(D/E)XK nuclease family protein [Thermohalobaculum sp.]
QAADGGMAHLSAGAARGAPAEVSAPDVGTLAPGLPSGLPSGLPGWLAPAPAEPRPARALAPSALGAEADAETGGAGRGREAALAHGAAVHLVLERLAGLAPATRAARAPALVAALVPGLDATRAAAAIAEAEAVLAAPFAESLFGPDSLAEAAIAARLADGTALLGRIDRLVIGPGRILAVDFKTDPAVPRAPGAVRPEYLAQLGAYRAALIRAWPGRAVATAILWTAEPALMALPDAAGDAAFAAAPTRDDGAA